MHPIKLVCCEGCGKDTDSFTGLCRDCRPTFETYQTHISGARALSSGKRGIMSGEKAGVKNHVSLELA